MLKGEFANKKIAKPCYRPRSGRILVWDMRLRISAGRPVHIYSCTQGQIEYRFRIEN